MDKIDNTNEIIEKDSKNSFKNNRRKSNSINNKDVKIRDMNLDLKFHMTPCGHIFHENCLRVWEENNKTCPMCRAKINYKIDNHN